MLRAGLPLAVCLLLSLPATAAPPLKVGQHRTVGTMCVTLSKITTTKVEFTIGKGGYGSATPNAVGAPCTPDPKAAQPIRLTAPTGPAPRVGQQRMEGKRCVTVTAVKGKRIEFSFPGGKGYTTGALGAPCGKGVVTPAPEPPSCIDRCTSKQRACMDTARAKRRRCLASARSRKRGAPKRPHSAALCMGGIDRCKKTFAACQKTCAPSGPAPGPLAGGALSAKDIKAVLDAHNRVRADVGVGPLVWAPEIANYAQKWADHLKKTKRCGLEHRSGKTQKKPWGENLASYHVSSGHARAVAMWASEKKFYTPGTALNDRNWYPSGHYTQVVWRSTKRVGCGVASCEGQVVMACNYDPPGNMMGQKPY